MNKMQQDIIEAAMQKIANYNISINKAATIKLANELAGESAGDSTTQQAEEQPGLFNGLWSGISGNGDRLINTIGTGIFSLLGPFSHNMGVKARNFADNTLNSYMDIFGNQSHPDAGLGYKLGKGLGNLAGFIPFVTPVMAAKSLITGSYDDPSVISKMDKTSSYLGQAEKTAILGGGTRSTNTLKKIIHNAWEAKKGIKGLMGITSSPTRMDKLMHDEAFNAIMEKAPNRAPGYSQIVKKMRNKKNTYTNDIMKNFSSDVRTKFRNQLADTYGNELKKNGFDIPTESLDTYYQGLSALHNYKNPKDTVRFLDKNNFFDRLNMIYNGDLNPNNDFGNYVQTTPGTNLIKEVKDLRKKIGY